MKIIQNLNGHIEKEKPIWMMRQAGRYLPEYRALRSNFPSFIDFCLNQDMATEATLQPVQRFDFDAAIIFSDILVVPHFLGQGVRFEEGVGPILEKPDWAELLGREVGEGIGVVYQAIRAVRKILDPQKALIGFVGGPWTLASYMISEGKTHDFVELVRIAKAWPLFERLMDKLVFVIAEHAINQLRAGADVVQLFESWAAAVPADLQKKWLFEPAKRVIQSIQAAVPGASIIYYGKGVALGAVRELSSLGGGFGVCQDVDLLGLGETTACLQGNLDPQKLLRGDFDEDVLAILDFAKGRPFIVNLGHGILPNTPISHVERFVELVRG